MAVLFGTDGVRGLANLELTTEVVMLLARAAPAVIAPGVSSPRFLVGRDTRSSGPEMEAAVLAGLGAAGADVTAGSVMPTPAVAALVRALSFDGGIMVTASHNPYQYSGLKFFARGGDKIDDRQQAGIEKAVAHARAGTPPHRVRPANDDHSLIERYANRIRELSPARLTGLRVIADCGHGALSHIAPRLLADMGAAVTPLNCSPNGTNINVGGVMQPQSLVAAVLQQRADAGIAFDGDGDRVVLVDENGRLVDGDQIIAIWASALHADGRLTNRTVVGTSISNGGLQRCLSSIGCRLARADVGDRRVYTKMRECGAILGGETCGHIIYSPHISSADGLQAGAAILSLMARSGEPLSTLADVMRKRPQISAGIPVTPGVDWRSDEVISTAIAEIERSLHNGDWLLVRPSGTEPVIRVTAECDDESEARRAVTRLSSLIQERITDVRGPLHARRV